MKYTFSATFIPDESLTQRLMNTERETIIEVGNETFSGKISAVEELENGEAKVTIGDIKRVTRSPAKQP